MSRQLIAIGAALIAASALAVAADDARAQPAPAGAPPAAGSPAPTAAGSEPPLFAPAVPAPAAAASEPPLFVPAAVPPPAVTAPEPVSVGDVGDQAISAEAGLATAGRVTPGGLRIIGHYLYQLSDQDWFDGAAGFTFGSGNPACFRDRSDALICEHGITDGTGVEISARIRRLFQPHGAFQALAQVGIGVGLVHFSGDGVSGLAIPLHAGGGVRVTLSPAVALIVEDELGLGFGAFGHGLGLQPQLDFAITAGAEFRLR